MEICGNFGECFGFIYVTAYKLAGGFVGYLYLKNEQIPNPKNNPPSFFDLFADVYVIMIYQIFFSVILVLVVDSFSMIRSENFLRQENLNKSCLICSLDRSLFNVSSTTNFKRHLAISHNIWAYFAYYHYILRKPVEKRTQFERTIYLNFNTDWLPNNYALGVKEPYPLE